MLPKRSPHRRIAASPHRRIAASPHRQLGVRPRSPTRLTHLFTANPGTLFPHFLSNTGGLGLRLPIRPCRNPGGAFIPHSHPIEKGAS